MATVRFFLKEPTATVETLIYLIYRIKFNRLKYSTGEKINPEYWIKQTQRANENILQNKELKQKNIDLNIQLGRYKDKTVEILNYWDYHKITHSIENLKTELDKEFKPKREETIIPEKQITFNGFIDKFITEIETGKRLTEKGKIFANGTIKSIKGFRSILLKYQNDNFCIIDFQDVTLNFYDKFKAYMTKQGYTVNSIGKQIRTLKTLMRSSFDLHLHNNATTMQRKFMAPSEETTDIYLNENELQKLYDLDLSKNHVLDLVRDVFLVGCETALRYSDYSRINETHIKQTSGGTKVISIKTKKTGERVAIPIKPKLDEILKKYSYNLPKTYEQKVNERIKTICKMAGINENVTIEKTTGGLNIEKNYPKYELVKTHTARRTGATNMFNAGISTIDIMKLTGHKTEKNFLKYIKMKQDETADKLSKHKYFTKGRMKIAN